LQKDLKEREMKNPKYFIQYDEGKPSDFPVLVVTQIIDKKVCVKAILRAETATLFFDVITTQGKKLERVAEALDIAEQHIDDGDDNDRVINLKEKAGLI
jgi:hypothetical protein